MSNPRGKKGHEKIFDPREPWPGARVDRFCRRFPGVLRPDLPRFARATRMQAASVLLVRARGRGRAAANRAAQSRSKIRGVMYAAFIPVLACILWQLHAVGKTSSREMLSMTIFFAVVLDLSAVAVFARYRFRLVPQQKHLEALLKQF